MKEIQSENYILSSFLKKAIHIGTKDNKAEPKH